MTKYFNAKVQVVQTRTVHVQVAADSEAAAAELALATVGHPAATLPSDILQHLGKAMSSL